MMKKATLFTTGYAGFDQDSFLWKLNLDGIEVIVDVREKAISRNSAFTQSRLKNFLHENGIDYAHFPQLGTPGALRQALRSGGSLKKYFAAYRKHLQDQQEALTGLYDLIIQKRCCLLCLETKAEECHRSILAEVLANRDGWNIEVKHV